MLKLRPCDINVSTRFSFTVNNTIDVVPDRCLWIIKQFVSAVVHEHDNGNWAPFGVSRFALYESKGKSGKKLVCYSLISKGCSVDIKTSESKFMNSNDLISRIVKDLIKEFDKYNIKINRLNVEMFDGVIQFITIV